MSRTHLLIPFLLVPFFSFSQNVGQQEKKAAASLAENDFQQALYHLKIIDQKKPGDPEVLTQLGICYYELDMIEQAANCLLSIKTEGPKIPADYYLYVGKIFHARLAFEEAIQQYKLFLKNSRKNESRRAAVKDAIRRCANGMMVRRQMPVGQVLLLDSTINSPGNEWRPLPSPNRPGTVYFSSERSRNSFAPSSFDIYRTERNETHWKTPLPLGLTINTNKEEWPLGFDRQGEVLYFFRGNSVYSGDILVDTFTEDLSRMNVVHAEFISPLKAWEGDCDPFYYDGQTILFASRREGGFGGLDIYVTKLTPTGWTNPTNLGPDINSAYDDRWPFLDADGRSLYFSTNDVRRSIGGSDILKSVFLEQAQKWTPPENLGIPFNSAADEECFFLSNSGNYAFFTSSRKTGFGKRDIYMALFPATNGGPSQPAVPFVFYKNTKEENRQNENAEAPSSEFVIAPMAYGNDQEPLSNEILTGLKKIKMLLAKYPQLKIILTGYASQDEQGIISVAAILQEAVGFLKKERIDLRQIRWQAIARKYAPRTEGQKVVDIFLANPEILSEYVKVEQTPGTTFQAGFFKKTMSGLVYQVQVPTGENVRVEEILRFYPEGILSQRVVGEPVYFSPGFHLSWSAALEAEKAVRQIGFYGTRVVPLLNGWELDKNSAAHHLHEYPELRYFMEKE